MHHPSTWLTPYKSSGVWALCLKGIILPALTWVRGVIISTGALVLLTGWLGLFQPPSLFDYLGWCLWFTQTTLFWANYKSAATQDLFSEKASGPALSKHLILLSAEEYARLSEHHRKRDLFMKRKLKHGKELASNWRGHPRRGCVRKKQRPSHMGPWSHSSSTTCSNLWGREGQLAWITSASSFLANKNNGTHDSNFYF